MNHPHSHRLAAAALVLVGAGLIVATIRWGWGHLAYGTGVVVVVAGLVWAVVTVVGSTTWRIGLGAGTALVAIIGAVLAVAGKPQPPPRWNLAADAQRPDDWSARTGDLIIIGGTARHVQTGKIAWSHEGPEASPLLVEDALVVIGTKDGSVGVEPSTGREIWRSTVTGRGIAHDGDILVVADTRNGTEAVALDLRTGSTSWRQRGRPVMECEFGPADRFAPAFEQSYVLLVRDEERKKRAELVDLTDGRTTIADVDCSVRARMVGEVLLQVDGGKLTGHSPVDGERLWSTPVEQAWNIAGSGAKVFTPTPYAEVLAIDVATGQSSRLMPPPGTRSVRLNNRNQPTPEVWALLDLGSRAALWNPGTGYTVEIPDAVTIRVDGVDSSSGWTRLSGTTQDLTGAKTEKCWAFSPDGHLSDPFPGRNCQVHDGVVTVQADVHPVG